MFYVIIGEDRAGSLAQRLAARNTRLQALQPKGQLLLAGRARDRFARPRPGRFLGNGIIIAEFASLEAAQTWADADPTSPPASEKVTVKPFRRCR